VTLHVPLEARGPDATRGLLDARRLSLLPRGAVVVNAARGEVLDGEALLALLASGRVGAALLDVWQAEPTPDPRLVRAAEVATPHIAGHSLDGKLEGTRMIYRAACQHLGREARWTPSLAPPPDSVVDTRGTDAEVLARALVPYYRLMDDDAELRRIVELPGGERGPAFRSHREHYPLRRELRGARVTVGEPRPLVARVLAVLGAAVDGAAATSPQ
jgi:erythronate-4-phosphate dehydrogenase